MSIGTRAGITDTDMMAAKSTPVLRALLLSTALLGPALLCAPAHAQLAPDQTAAGTNRPLQLAADSPFRDPDIIYLEADELINDEAAQVLTATGQVEGRYQDRTLRADRVDYNIETGMVLASGNVVLVDATGDVQYADNLELSDQLQAGTAANFTARLASGATTAARFVTRGEDGEFTLFNVTYTACEICKKSDGTAETPTWRLRARKVRQDQESRTVRYNDAVIELFGLPIFYLPYLAHPDPSADRASGLLTPGLSNSGARGLTYSQPYYWAVDDYSEITATSYLFSKVNPLLQIEGRRKFATGTVNLDTSLTYSTIFDRNGDPLTDPARFINPADAAGPNEALGHFNLDGYFRPNDTWSYGYTVQLISDDTYLDRYGLSRSFKSNGLITRYGRQNLTQAFISGQGENYRVSALAAGFDNLNTTYTTSDTTGLISVFEPNDDLLPIIAPKLTGEYYVTDPLVGGRLRLFGDTAYLTREEGNDYGRASAGAEYSKTMILPGGMEAKPYVWGRYDQFDIEAQTGTTADFGRGVGQVGMDLRYPFIRRDGSVSWIIEPRVLMSHGFGNAKLDRFTDPLAAGGVTGSLFEDGNSPNLDPALLFEPNKADGYDFFQEGTRVDVGGQVSAQWTMNDLPSDVTVFAGRSYTDGVEGAFNAGSGLAGENSDYVGQVDVNLGSLIRSTTRLRYDADRDVLSRLDTTLGFNTKYVSGFGRYYKINTAQPLIGAVTGTPPEEISGRVTVKPLDNVSLSYFAVRDLDADVTRSQRVSLGYRDDCTLLELYYEKRDFDSDVIRNDASVGVRLTLLTLGSLGSN